ncbi:ABC transporter ATP-binding protein [Peribacillus simplex]|uniref:ABC transporter ATP-binding protein n=1 Tax=Peribacillus simplex TaxID=1478 RepID=UPI0025A1D6B4|nr:ABC transporter ATP-binding protein [Peribacillus simplex]MDM5292011.1 ABC transporter ATP-binding protein [Peribacillus simplex]
MKAIEVKDLKKEYSTKEILRGIDFSVNKGEVFGFLGRNGAGKSTFIHILTGITNKTSGSFSILGQNDTEMDQIKKKIGVMPDTSNLYQYMNSVNFLKYMGGIKGDSRSRKEYIELLNKVGLFNVEKQKIKSFSFGMKKKISIAQALLGNPDLIFLDEPTSGLDPESSIEIEQLILKLKSLGKTIFLTSHNLDEIERICDRVAIMNEGKIVKIGTINELKNDTNKSIQLAIRTIPFLNPQSLKSLLQSSIRYIKQQQDFTILELDNEESIPELVELLTANQVKIYEMKIEKQSLQDVFMAV